MKGMDEDWDVGSPVFEERIRDLFHGGALRGVSAASVMHEARRRRVRRRATAAGASFAVLGLAAGAVAFGGHAVRPSRTTGVDGAVKSPAVTSPVTSPAAGMPAAPTSPQSTPPMASAESCSASVSGTAPVLTPTSADGLDFEKISGNSAGATWSAQIHVFPDWQSWQDWRQKQPVQPSLATLQGPPALVQAPGNIQMVLQQADYHFFGFSGYSIAGAVVNGAPTKTFVVYSWIEPGVDHLCLQFAHHAEFEPAYRIQGGTFAVFSYTAADEPLDAIGYDVTGAELGRSNGNDALRPPTGR